MTENRDVQPVRPSDRILALDVLRGFAMFGVLIAYCMWSLGTAPSETYSKLDIGIDTALGFAVDGKMYTILAFLFGLGFSMQLQRAGDDAAAARTYRRRLAALAVIGLLHALLLRNGDILLPYALTGFLLVPLRKSSDRVLIAAAGVALLFPYLANYLWEASGAPFPERPHHINAPYLVENAAWVRYWLELAPFTWPQNLVLFLFGFLAGHHQLLGKLARNRRQLAAMLVGGAVAGTFFYFLRIQVVNSDQGMPLRSALIGLSYTFHCWGLSSAYVAVLLLVLGMSSGPALLGPLAAIGRMALTNYLMQAALIVPLCLIFGWFDRFTPGTALLLALAVFILVQVPFSQLWLRHYQYGPAEWVWRLLTYGRAPPLKAAADYAPV
jgi:uncharacterized protein